mgnify:CR=1 FL=1
MVVIKTVSLLFAAAAAFLVAGNAPASAQDTLKIAVPQRGAWDTSITEIGNRAGIFKKHGVNAELLFTGGGAEALGAIIGQSIDAAVSVGISTVLGSFSKGAPVRVFSAETTGQPDIYWFVPAQSPIRSVADFKDKTIGYSVSGSSSHAALLALACAGEDHRQADQHRRRHAELHIGDDRPGRCGVEHHSDRAQGGRRREDLASWPGPRTSSACATAPSA